jgi:DNA polymerase-3 subunit gamma/tau
MREAAPFPAAASRAAGYAETATLTEGALAKAPEPAAATGDGLSSEHVREAIVAALATAGHSSAAQLLGAGEWKLDGTSVRIAVPGMGKKMLSLTVNAAAEKIIRQELQRLGAPARFLVATGSGTVPTVVTPPVVPAGSVQETALAHPLVKLAQEIFKAEVRSVVDLRKK